MVTVTVYLLQRKKNRKEPGCPYNVCAGFLIAILNVCAGFLIAILNVCAGFLIAMPARTLAVPLSWDFEIHDHASAQFLVVYYNVKAVTSGLVLLVACFPFLISTCMQK
jgi:hypothetical protein